jgi:DNA-binding transcriptional MocR family regulator
VSVLPDPGVISFARGVPAPETFPLEALARATRRAIERHGRVALNYGEPAGFAPLREWLGRQHEVSAERILITPGSIMGLGFLTHLLTRDSARAAVEAPTYDRMLSTLRRVGVETASINRDADGLDLEEARRLFTQPVRPSFFYTMPTFHNPTGLTMTRDQREELADLIAELEVVVVEDDPYGLLRIDGEPLPRLHELLRQRGADHLAILLSSFSKTVAPGLRVGYVITPAELVQPLRELAVAAYVSPPILAQAELYEYLCSGDLEPHLDELRAFLRPRRDAMLGVFDELMPPAAGWTRPEGGYFLWLQLPPPLRATEVAKRAAEAGVTFVPGGGFFVGARGDDSARLSFSFPAVESVRRGALALVRLMHP